MKTVFVALNAKYIHTSPSVRLLAKAACKEFDVTFFEFTIKDSIDNIIEKIKAYDSIGLSCYIWNITKMKQLALKIKNIYPEKIIFAGGPEVSYEPEAFTEFFDYIICGEGEETIIPFLKSLSIGNTLDLPYIANKNKPYAIPHLTQNSENIPEIFDMYSEDDLKNKIIYTEFSRGCPFNCSYCLSSAEKGVRILNSTHFEKTFEFIENNHFKCIKFLDRTFNINPKKFIEICKKLEDTENTYQFEIEAGLFNEQVIDFLCNEVTPKKFRLEIGIQSLNENSLTAVNRNQNNENLLKTIQMINTKGRCTVHADLIAGLPFETFETFKDSFNKTFMLECEELQLGFLKMLRGTAIRKYAEEYQYKYQQNEPYEITENKFMTKSDLTRIHNCEESLDWLWNSKNAVSLIKHLIKEKTVTDWFEFFEGFHPYYEKQKPLHDNYENILKYLSDFNLLCKEYIYDLKSDYLTKVKIRPKPFWKNYAYEDFGKIKNELKDKYEINRNSFITTYYNGFLIINYCNEKAELKIIRE